MTELMVRARKHMNADDAMNARKNKDGEDKRLDKKRPAPSTRDERELKYKKFSNNQADRSFRRPASPGRYNNYTPLNTSVEQVFLQIQDDASLKWPPKLKANPTKRSRDKYCRFHRDHGHNTEDCFDLKNQIENLVHKGEIKVISGGFAGGGETSSARKAHARRIRSFSEVNEVGMTSPPTKLPRVEEPVITFSEEDDKGIHQPHDDLLVVSMVVANFTVRRILIDNGSSADILFLRAYEKLKIGREKLRPMKSPPVGFSGDKVYPLGAVTLPVTAGANPKQVTVMVDFVVVDCPSSYNIILERTTLNAMKAITSTYHLLMRFPTEYGMGEIRGDQTMARECYVASLRKIKSQETFTIEGLEGKDIPDFHRAEPTEELEEVILGEPKKKVSIGSLLPPGIKDELTQFLRKNQDVFAWVHEDMQGIDPTIMEHRLNVNPDFKPVRQKRRTFALERNQAISEEVEKLLKADFIQEVYYPDWLANVVLVKKANGKWRLCVDFTDLNKACPKDSFPLPRINMLIKGTAGHELFSFMDAYSGYNQISMYTSDREKTAFITDRGLYCYKVMPFGLKNAGATYQRLVNAMFKHQIGRNMEVYVDDMLVKSLKAEDRLTDLQETFEVLRSHKMKLNPSKCAFGVSSGKLLGYMVSRRGIEANPEKIRAVIDMRSPRSTKDLQRLTRKIAALSRLISRSTDRCLPFFRVLRKAFEWTPECEQAFKELKQYLSSPPLLSRTIPGEELYIYLAVSTTAVSSALIREEEGVQRPVYFVSKALRGAEERYSRMEQLAFALIVSARKLRPYFQAHTIVVLTDQPLRQVLHKPESSGRLMKWSVELGEFDIQYKPRTAVKAQVLADFLAEFTPPEEEKQPQFLTEPSLSEQMGPEASGAGLVLVSPKGENIQYALRFGFKTTNNEAEYEALIAGLKVENALGVEQLKVYTDSQLVAGQVQAEYEARDEKMKSYLQKVKELKNHFQRFSIHQIPREENGKADALARLATALEPEINKNIPLEYLDEPSISQERQIEVQQAILSVEWADPIIRYIKDGVLPKDRKANIWMNHLYLRT
ncbi:uncharacterized protein LOC132270548 [Cornus florida]|uniref:uncharacterized protein LOC132270548 n=1 Tax=Cornus florida TaxID=4283 RepID=UPI0028A0D51F|nr:uncharacterized protein LOC132270548 [Cornus florida]